MANGLRLSPLLAVMFLASFVVVSAQGVRASRLEARQTGAGPTLLPPRRYAYAALGASETYGIGASSPRKSYAYLVAHALHARHFADVGIPGATLASGYSTELGGALSIRPSLSSVFFGVNDLRARVRRSAFMANLHDLVATLRQAGSRVLIIGLPDLSLIPAVARAHFPHLHRILTSWNSGMKRVARQTNSRFLDLTAFCSELARHARYISGDGLHPSNAGHARLAQVVLQAIHRQGLWGRG